MPLTDKSVSNLVTGTANRLRLMQADLADADDRTRQEVLSSEIDRALAKLVPGRRQDFLEALLVRFPTWETSPRALAPRPAPAADLQDPEVLVSCLVALAGDLQADRRAALVEQLRAGGLQEGCG